MWFTIAAFARIAEAFRSRNGFVRCFMHDRLLALLWPPTVMGKGFRILSPRTPPKRPSRSGECEDWARSARPCSLILSKAWCISPRTFSNLLFASTYIIFFSIRMSKKQDVISDMDDSTEMRADAVCSIFIRIKWQINQASIAIQRQNAEKDVSIQIKTYFDSKYGSNWHCVIGKHFSHFGSYEGGTYIFFHVGQLAVLLYRMS